MKQRVYTAFLTILLIISMSLTTFAASIVPTEEQMRGVWVASVYNLDYPTKETTNAATLKAEADSILDGAAAMGLNAVFLQVRPSSDALYASDIFPWSAYLTGTQGTAPADGFDPLTYWIDGAHARGLELHAWINPYRITKQKAAEWNALAATNPAKLHPEWVKQYTDGNYYYDPGIPQVRQLVVDGVQEILDHYAVDGIHMDDYFYPGTDFDDAASYAAYGAGYSNIGDWRRENVNLLVRAVNQAVHTKNADLAFGISPAGVWANKSNNSRGSNTNGGYESYYACYADSLGWIQEGCIDYIVPQIYWQIGHPAADYATLVDWWSNAVSGSDVKLYIGEAAYKCDDAEQGAVWQGSTEIVKHLQYCQNRQAVSGQVYFRYGSLQSVAGLSSAVSSYYAAQPVGTDTVTAEDAQQIGTQSIGYLQTLLLFFTSVIR